MVAGSPPGMFERGEGGSKGGGLRDPHEKKIRFFQFKCLLF